MQEVDGSSPFVPTTKKTQPHTVFAAVIKKKQQRNNFCSFAIQIKFKQSLLQYGDIAQLVARYVRNV